MLFILIKIKVETTAKILYNAISRINSIEVWSSTNIPLWGRSKIMVHNLISKARLSILAILVFALLIGCSSGGDGSFPIIPEINNPASELTGNMDTPSIVPDSSHNLLVYNMIYVDPDHPDGPKIEVIPLRIGEMHLNILKFLETGLCTDCFKILGFSFPEADVFDIDIEITHPFSDYTFTIFDTRGIMMFPGSREFPVAGKSTSDPSLGDFALLNPDGYTALFNGNTFGDPIGDILKYFPGYYSTDTIPDSDINGFQYFTSEGVGTSRNVLYAGDLAVRTISIQLADGPFYFGYAVDANWDAPINTPPMTIDDFDFDANCPEPWQVIIIESDENLTNEGGTTRFVLDVYDWEGKDTFDPPTVECPELFTGILTAAWITDNPGYSRYEVIIPNDNLAHPGDYMVLVSVLDTDIGGDHIAFQIEMVTVNKVLKDPIAVAIADPETQLIDLPVYFSGLDSYDPDGGDIDFYEWDWNNDGIYDDEGAEIYHVWDTAGTYHVQLRVTDDESDTDKLDTPLEIEIVADPKDPVACGDAVSYTGMINEEVCFFDCGSYDPDGGDIVLGEWDWDNDGVYDDEGFEICHIWTESGVYKVMYRVTDDEGATDEIDSPLIIYIGPMPPVPPVACGEASTLFAAVDELINFTDCGSLDPDGGEIVLGEWDWDYKSGDGFIPDEEGFNVWHSWDQPGGYLVQYRVTDDEGVTDILNEAIVVTISNVGLEAVYVASGGDDSGAGTYDDPLAHISAGLQKADALGFDTVYVAKGDYEEFSTIRLKDGINIYGACDPGNGWVQLSPPDRSTVTFNSHYGYGAVVGQNISGDTFISQLEIRAASVNPEDRNSVALYLAYCSANLHFDNCIFQSFDGYNSENGVDGAQGLTGEDGGKGGNATYSSSMPDPGVPEGESYNIGGAGGHPGYSNVTPSQDGFPGSCGASGGEGGANGDEGIGTSGENGGDGDPGDDGADGDPGSGGNGIGTVLLGIWQGSDGEDGDMGEAGCGGGGGGGGGGFRQTSFPHNIYYGGAGGAGAAGGYGGDGGTRGIAGGGSICVFLADSYASFYRCYFLAGDGGNGGNSGFGGLGGLPGEPGPGGSGSSWGPGYGGRGGYGGYGGDGGSGGGGGGGISFCVYNYFGSNPGLPDCFFQAGQGGSGGDSPGGPAYDGQPGLAGEIYP